MISFKSVAAAKNLPSGEYFTTLTFDTNSDNPYLQRGEFRFS